ncbi:hypothetical protein [Pseudodesulfovibrio indicus]|nr:hypothetical protein [Pseudodesulfovibrio indicus]
MVIKLVAGEDVIHTALGLFLAESFEQAEGVSGSGLGWGPFILVKHDEAQSPAVRQEFQGDPPVAFKIDAGVPKDVCEAVAMRDTRRDESMQLFGIEPDIGPAEWFAFRSHCHPLHALGFTGPKLVSGT